MAYQFTRIAVKIGSNVLARTDGTPDVTRMSALVDQIAELHKAGQGQQRTAALSLKLSELNCTRQEWRLF